MFKPLPFVSDEVLQSIHENAERTADGCLLLHPHTERSNPNCVTIDDHRVNVTRLIWAENEGEAGLDTHEVVHIPECPHVDCVGKPVCIEPTHLMLSTPQERARIRYTREGGK